MFHEPIWSYDGFDLIRRPDTPNYHVYWKPARGGRGCRQSTGTSDLEEAKRKLVELAKRVSRPVAKSEENVLLLDCLVDYVQPILERSHGPKPERTALRHWLAFIETSGISTVADLTLDLQDLYVQRRKHAMVAAGYKGSTATIARELGVMRAALRHAWKRGLLSNLKYVRSMPQAAPRARFLFPEEAQRLLAACEEDHLRLFVLLALHTLQRPGAILGLTVDQVRLREGLIDFLPSGTVQSRKRRPVVPISDTLRPVLEHAVAESMSGFVIEHRDKPLRSVRRTFRTACDAADLQNVTPGTLRHTGATLLLALGVPIREVSGMLGHTEAKTTEMYGKHHPAFLKNAVAAVDTLFKPASPETACAKPAPEGDSSRGCDEARPRSLPGDKPLAIAHVMR